MIHSRVSWMSLPVDRSITVSAPHLVRPAAASRPPRRSTSDTAELPMLALIFTRKLRPMIIGSGSGWLMLAGMMARPRATSSRTNSGVHALAQRDEAHLLGDIAAARVVHLGAVAVSPRGEAALDPRLAQLAAGRAATSRPCGPGGVVDVERRLAARQLDLAERDAQPVLLDVDLGAGNAAGLIDAGRAQCDRVTRIADPASPGSSAALALTGQLIGFPRFPSPE